jgi:hypothetical protein
MYYADKFMNSQAGIALKSDLDKSRKRHSTLPAVNEETLLNYAGAEGIHWGTKELVDFFYILCEYTTTVSFEALV